MAKVTKKKSAGRKAVQQVRAPRKDEEVEALTRVTARRKCAAPKHASSVLSSAPRSRR